MNGCEDTRALVPLVINADDFGYFDEVSRGILEAAAAGVVTATGVMANGPALGRWIHKLIAMPAVSIGVHLNATLGTPLTASMSDALKPYAGRFPGKGRLIAEIQLGRLPQEMILEEWRMQVQQCLQAGAAVQFLNSHEHVHMLPGLYPRVRQLARDFGIPHVRAPHPEWGPRIGLSGLVRSTALSVARLFGGSVSEQEPVLIGLNPSGHLDLNYCRWRFRRIDCGRAYELMCHPGHTDPLALGEPRLRDYHDWEGELSTLMSPAFSALLRQNGLRLANYGDLI